MAELNKEDLPSSDSKIEALLNGLREIIDDAKEKAITAASDELDKKAREMADDELSDLNVAGNDGAVPDRQV